MKRIELSCFEIVVETDDFRAGSISSNLHENGQAESTIEEALISQYNAAIDGIESMILAHACAGIDISSPAYLEGIETAAEAISNNFS